MRKKKKKRKLDLELETSRNKLRLLNAERELVDVELASASASRSLSDNKPSLHFGDDFFATVSQAVTDALLAFRTSTPTERQPSLINRLAIQKQNISFSGNTFDWFRFKKAYY